MATWMRSLISLPIIGIAGALGGCTLHPLQNEVTDLPLYEVVHKIRCEAKESVVGLLEAKDLSALKLGLDDANKHLDATKKRILKPLQDEKKGLDSDKLTLQREAAGVSAQLDLALAVGDEALNRGIETPQIKSAITVAITKYKKFLVKKQAYRVKIADYDQRYFDVNRIVEAEIKSIDTKFARVQTFFGHQMAYSFKFNIKETDVATPTGSYKFPIHLGSMTVSLSGGDTKDRESERNVKLVASFGDLNDLDCLNAAPDTRGLRTFHFPIKGSIGVEEVITQYLRLYDSPKGKFAKDAAAAYTDSITFTTTLTGSVNPQITITPTPLTQVVLGVTGGPTRKDLHNVIISLSPPVASEAATLAITRVQLIKDDGI